MERFLFLVITLIPVHNCIMVITSEKNERPQLDGHFVIPGLNLSSLDTFTMCGRFNIYQFFVETSESVVNGNIKTLFHIMQGIFPGFGTFSLIRKSCIRNDTLCIDLKNQLITQWAWKHIFAWTYFYGNLKATPTILVPNAWNSFCMNLNKTSLTIKVNKFPPIVLSNDNDSMPFLFSGNFVFMNIERPEYHHNMISPMFGAFTDLNVWNTILSKEDEDSWIKCQFEKEGNVISWKEYGQHVQMTGLKIVNESLKNICPKEFRHLIVASGNKDFYDTVNYCNKFGSIADISNMDSINEVANILEPYNDVDVRVFTGYTDLEVEGEWIHYNSRKKLALVENWYPGEPNSWGGNEDCITIYKASLKFNDDSCFEKRSMQVCSMYEVMVNPTFRIARLDASDTGTVTHNPTNSLLSY